MPFQFVNDSTIEASAGSHTSSDDEQRRHHDEERHDEAVGAGEPSHPGAARTPCVSASASASAAVAAGVGVSSVIAAPRGSGPRTLRGARSGRP